MGRKQEVISADTFGAYPALETLGFSARRPVVGPEWDLVASYVDSSLPHAPRGQVRTVFIEPRIASGFPDIVVVYWSLATASRWSAERAELSASDIRVLHYLVENGPIDHAAFLAAFPRNLDSALDRLVGARVVHRTRSAWHALALHRIFAVRRLIAIEAKVAEWRIGLTQALRNTWFASESYLLLARHNIRSSLVREAQSLGVGIVTVDQKLDHATTAAKADALPKSYVSWLFNEWAWRTVLEGPASSAVGTRPIPRRLRARDD